MDYGSGWGPFLCGFLMAGVLLLMPIALLAGLWIRAEVRQMFSRLEEFLENEDEEEE